MLLKRKFDEARRCTHVLVKHTGASARQNFSHRLVEQALVDGWMQIQGDTLVIRAEPEDLTFRLLRTPGYYCSSSGDRIPVSTLAWSSPQRGVLARREALAWLATNGKAEHDYEVTNAYDCVLCEEQHEKFGAVAGPKGQIVAAHRLQQEG